MDIGLKKDFPIFNQKINGHDLSYLDSGASAQKPYAVIDAMTGFYKNDYANIHRGVHELSQRATKLYDDGRISVQKFLNAKYFDEIIFTRGATDAINLVAGSWGRAFLKKGDEIVLTQLEHHANIVPWQMLRDEIGVVLKIVPFQKDGEILIDDVKSVLSSKTKLVSVAHVSNALGTILPVKEISAIAHDVGAVVLIDGCQSAPHIPIDVQDIDADFYVFSGHKLYGPTGIGVLYGKREILKNTPPYQGGGDMIKSVTFEKTIFQDSPMRFEAGTPPIAEVIGMHAAIDYINNIGWDKIILHEKDLLNYANEQLSKIDNLKLIGTAKNKCGIVSFVMDKIHPHDIGTILDSEEGVAIRAGHHCAQPTMEALGIMATVRASFGLYNTKEDIDALVCGLKKVQKIFG